MPGSGRDGLPESQEAKIPQGQGAEEEDQIVGPKFAFEFGPIV